MTGTHMMDNTPLNPTLDADILITPDKRLSADKQFDLGQPEARSLIDPDTIQLQQIISNEKTPWQIHNCKIIDKVITQDAKLPFIYHYDALSDELKAAHPLTPELLKQFQTPLYASDAATLLKLAPELIPIPWQVKITGTVVMFYEQLQLAMRLKFTNTAKKRDPIYSKTQADALKIALQNWHFYGDVFVLNKSNHPLVMTIDDSWLNIPRLNQYQLLPAQYSLAALALLEAHKQHLPQLTEALELRLA